MLPVHWVTPKRIASAMRAALALSATSCTRRIFAPPSTAATAAARLPSKPLVGFQLQNLADESLARNADQKRLAEYRQGWQTA